MFLNFSDFEPRIILKYQRCNFTYKFKEYILILVDVLLHHKSSATLPTKLRNIFQSLFMYYYI